MNRTVASLALAAAAAAPFFAGCMANPPSGGARIATQEHVYRPGQGLVIAATQARAPLSAAAGGTATAVGNGPAGYRLAVRMGDGTVQYVDTDANIPVGARVELGADHTIREL